jgi:drug/metabolite transporter (DMT)-like permease
LILPFLSSGIYVLGALLVRRAADLGVCVWRTTFISNSLSAVLFLPLWFLGGPGQPWTQFWQPCVVALAMVAGQTFGFYSLTRGDVTVVTPVLGIKTLVVALLTPVLLGLPVPARLWMAAGLSTGGIVLLNLSGGGPHRRLVLSILGGLAAAGSFALFDVLIQRWSPIWGAGRLVPLVMGLGAVFSVGLIPLSTSRCGEFPATPGNLCSAVRSASRPREFC